MLFCCAKIKNHFFYPEAYRIVRGNTAGSIRLYSAIQGAFQSNSMNFSAVIDVDDRSGTVLHGMLGNRQHFMVLCNRFSGLGHLFDIRVESVIIRFFLCKTVRTGKKETFQRRVEEKNTPLSQVIPSEGRLPAAVKRNQLGFFRKQVYYILPMNFKFRPTNRPINLILY